LGEVISTPELRHWEIHDAEPRLKFDLDVYDETPELSNLFCKGQNKVFFYFSIYLFFTKIQNSKIFLE
jgi:hypothetical protein